jgi:hypothetical protein
MRNMFMKSNMRHLAVLIVLSLAGAHVLTGCGTYVPEIEDFPGRPADGTLLVNAIVQSVRCEAANAVKNTIDQAALGTTPTGQSSVAWFYGWGAQVTLSLTLEEKSTINPSTVLTPVGPLTTVFTLLGSFLGSSDATRTDAVNFYWSVPELYKRAPCTTGIQPKNSAATSFLIQSDLKLQQWLQDQVLPSATGEVTFPTSPDATPFGKNVISHEVKFQVVTTGDVTPAWKLIQVNFNQTGNLLELSRLRTHDLTITFGPGNFKGLSSDAAKNAHLASQIGLAVSNNLNTVRPGLPF